MRPAIEEPLDVGGAERITRSLQRVGIGTGEKAIVETREADPVVTQALPDPLVTVQTQFHRIREIRPDLQERWPPIPVVDIEVVVLDRHGLPRKVERHRLARPAPFVGLERSHLLLRHAKDDDPLAGREPRTVAGDDGVFILARFEFDFRNLVLSHEGLDRGDKAIVDRAKQGWRRNRVPEMIVQEIAEAA